MHLEGIQLLAGEISDFQQNRLPYEHRQGSFKANKYVFCLFCSDPYEHVWQTKTVTPDKCNNNCDPIAICACGLVYGDYKCACPMGYAGSGVVGHCNSKLVNGWGGGGEGGDFSYILLKRHCRGYFERVLG